MINAPAPLKSQKTHVDIPCPSLFKVEKWVSIGSARLSILNPLTLADIVWLFTTLRPFFIPGSETIWKSLLLRYKVNPTFVICSSALLLLSLPSNIVFGKTILACTSLCFSSPLKDKPGKDRTSTLVVWMTTFCDLRRRLVSLGSRGRFSARLLMAFNNLDKTNKQTKTNHC